MLTDTEFEIIPRVFVDFLQLSLERERELCDGGHVAEVSAHVTLLQTGSGHVRRGNGLDLLDALELRFLHDLKVSKILSRLPVDSPGNLGRMWCLNHPHYE